MIYESNKWVLLYILLICITTDVFAYLIGSLIGKHKITKISPKKSYEGSIGGIIASTLVGVTYYTSVIDNENIVSIIILSIIMSVISQMGDIVFSKIKRENNIKDFSNLIPGHGGILDRIDSLTFAVFTYIILCTII